MGDTTQMPLDEREQHLKRQGRIASFRPSQKWKLFLWQIWRWTGLGEKKLWDFLQLLIVPVVLWGLSSWFNHKETIRKQEEAKETNQQEALISYIDNLPTLLKDTKTEEYIVRGLAQAKTSTTLQLLKDDPNRREVLLDFLRVSGLLGTFQDSQKQKAIESILEGINLKNRVLQGADLHRANLKDADLRNTDLVEANLNNANLSGAKLGEADLRGATLRRANLRKASLIGANLKGADLEGANLIDANFDHAKIGENVDTKGDRKKTNFRNAFYTEAFFAEGGINTAKVYIDNSPNPVPLVEDYKKGMLPIEPNLQFPPPDPSSPPPDFLSYTDLSGSSVNLTGANLTGVNLTGANLQQTNLSSANLKGADLSSANLTGANLSRANLKEAELTGVNLTKANLKDAMGISPETLKKAILCQTTMPDGTKNSDNCPPSKQK